MIVGLGTDLLVVARMRRELARAGGGFKDQVFTPAEAGDCEGRPHPERYFAARFAAKEALFKALGARSEDGVAWREVEVREGHAVPPRIVLHGQAASLAARRGATRVLVALAHTADWASAMVLLES